MPGLLITTLQASKASRPPRSVVRTSKPPRVASAGLSSTRTGRRPIDSRRRRLAFPDVAGKQSLQAAPIGGQDLKAAESGLSGLVVHQDREKAHRLETTETGLSFDPQAPQADRGASERG